MRNIDTLIPARPAMPVVSRTLHNSGRYNACTTRAGLIVQSHASGTGQLLPTSHVQYADYVSAFDDLIDAAEGDALCRALLA